MGIEKDKIWIPFIKRIMSTQDDVLNEIEIKRLIEKLGTSKKKAISIIIENGLSQFIDRFKEYWEEDYDVFCFNLDVGGKKVFKRDYFEFGSLFF